MPAMACIAYHGSFRMRCPGGIETLVAPLCCLLVCCLFVLAGALLIPYGGIQNDEAIFANALYQPADESVCISVLGRQVPVMITDHIGTLKSLLYWPIFRVFAPGAFSVRLPMVLAGALTIWIFFHFATIAAGTRVALLGVLLLASDPSFLLTVTFDWGPVALERLLLVSACYLATRFAERGRQANLAAAFFLLGLALWNRADFVWGLAGLGAAAVVVFPPEIRRSLHARAAGLAVVSFILGALPLIAYNFHRPNATLANNARVQIERFPEKFQQLRQSADGSDLLGYLVSNLGPSRPDDPGSLRRRIAYGILRRAGVHTHSGGAWAFALATLAIPLWWRSRAARFALVYMAATWFAIVVTRDAGYAAHHVMMLWPFPQLFLAVAIGSLRWKAVSNAAAIVLVVLNLLVVGQYFVQFELNGAGDNFSDALVPLSAALPDDSAHKLYVTDWGMFNTIELLHRGHVHSADIGGFFSPHRPLMDAEAAVTGSASDPEALYVGHVPGRETFAGGRERLEQAAASTGYRKEILRVIQDSNGRPVFELFRLSRAQPSLP